jgi:hypothetical protein
MQPFEILLAFAEPSQAQARSSGGSQYLLLAAGIAAVALAIAGFYVWNSRRKPRDPADEGSSRTLLQELCDAHQLSRPDRALLAKCVQTYELPQPASLFVDPWPLDQAAALNDPDSAQYTALRQRLFGPID